MKYLSAIILLFLTFSIPACKKESNSEKDITSPTITLIGDANLELPQGVAASDPGATAHDDVDGDISYKITSDWSNQVTTSAAGSYMVTYSVSDKAGNQATTKRTVNIKYTASGRQGEYNSTYTNGYGTSPVFTSTVSAGDNLNQFVIYPFSGKNLAMKVNLSGALGNQLSFSQSAWGNTYTGNGSIDNFGNTINLTYMVYTGIGNFPHTSVLTKK